MLSKIIDTVKKAGEIVLSAHNQENAVTAKEGKKNFVTKYDVAGQSAKWLLQIAENDILFYIYKMNPFMRFFV